MSIHKTLNIVTASAEGNCIIYLLKENGTLIELYRLQTDFHLKEPCQVLQLILFILFSTNNINL